MKAILAAHSADLVTFSLAVGLLGIPIGQEENPTMVAAYLFAGLVGVAAWKLLLAATLVLLVRRVDTRPRRIAVLLGYAGGLVGTAANVVAMIR